jgi:hypothetical protein
MTLEVELTPQEAERLAARAEARGVSIAAALKELIAQLPNQTGTGKEFRHTPKRRPITPELIERVRATRGKYAHIPTSSEEFARQKQEEIETEEAQYARRTQEKTV